MQLDNLDLRHVPRSHMEHPTFTSPPMSNMPLGAKENREGTRLNLASCLAKLTLSIGSEDSIFALSNCPIAEFTAWLAAPIL